jgi:hypothetical protein
MDTFFEERQSFLLHNFVELHVALRNKLQLSGMAPEGDSRQRGAGTDGADYIFATEIITPRVTINTPPTISAREGACLKINQEIT